MAGLGRQISVGADAAIGPSRVCQGGWRRPTRTPSRLRQSRNISNKTTKAGMTTL